MSMPDSVPVHRPGAKREDGLWFYGNTGGYTVQTMPRDIRFRPL